MTVTEAEPLACTPEAPDMTPPAPDMTPAGRDGAASAGGGGGGDDDEPLGLEREVPVLAEVKVKATRTGEGEAKRIRVVVPPDARPVAGGAPDGGKAKKPPAKGAGGDDDEGPTEDLESVLIGAGEKPLKDYPFKLLIQDPDGDQEVTPESLDGGVAKNPFRSGWWWTDAQGRISFKGVPAREYFVSLWSRTGKIVLSEDDLESEEPNEETGDDDLRDE